MEKTVVLNSESILTENFTVVFSDETTKPFENREDMERFKLDTKYKDIVLSGATKYINIILGK